MHIAQVRQQSADVLDKPMTAFYSDYNRELEISTTPTKAKSREPAYSQAVNQNKIDKQGSKIQLLSFIDLSI